MIQVFKDGRLKACYQEGLAEEEAARRYAEALFTRHPQSKIEVTADRGKILTLEEGSWSVSKGRG
jgi:hypothetical protein